MRATVTFGRDHEQMKRSMRCTRVIDHMPRNAIRGKDILRDLID